MRSKGQGYTPGGPHHFYTGGIVLMAGFVCIFYCRLWVTGPLLGTGMYLILDDIWQHLHQGHDLLWIKARPAYCSPVNRAYWHALLWLISHTKEGSAIRRLLEWMRRV